MVTDMVTDINNSKDVDIVIILKNFLYIFLEMILIIE